MRLVPARRADAKRSKSAPGAISARQARWLFARCAPDDLRRMRQFVGHSGLRAASPRAMSDAELRKWILDRIESGALVALQSADAEDNAASPWAPLRKLAAQIEDSVPGGFRLAGFLFRIAAGIDLRRIEDRERFELASHEEARRILSEIAQQKNTPPAAVPLLKKAGENLSRDWRPPLEPDGLVVLRRKLFNRTTRPTIPDIVTPSQMVPRVEKTWIEIELVDEDGEPYVGDIELTLPDGQRRRGTSNKDGLLRLDGIVAGQCEVTLPEMDSSGWERQ